VARSIRRRLAFHPADAVTTTLDDVLRALVAAIETAGVLVMKSGIVGNNTRRKLDPDEFRGFALVDVYAPLVFVNGSDSKAAQLFTLVHELVHVWIGESALSNLQATYAPAQQVERYCNAVAAEYLVPEEPLRLAVGGSTQEDAALVQSLRGRFKVSSLVILRRLRDIGRLKDDRFRQLYREEVEEFQRREERKPDGGDYYRNQPVKVSRRFAVALVGSTLEGKTPYRDAFALLDMKKPKTFRELARKLDFPVR
jgi:Zn-dependent peptidase ImmA (M78 family)